MVQVLAQTPPAFAYREECMYVCVHMCQRHIYSSNILWSSWLSYMSIVSCLCSLLWSSLWRSGTSSLPPISFTLCICSRTFVYYTLTYDYKIHIIYLSLILYWCQFIVSRSKKEMEKERWGKYGDMEGGRRLIFIFCCRSVIGLESFTHLALCLSQFLSWSHLQWQTHT